MDTHFSILFSFYSNKCFFNCIMINQWNFSCSLIPRWNNQSLLISDILICFNQLFNSNYITCHFISDFRTQLRTLYRDFLNKHQDLVHRNLILPKTGFIIHIIILPICNNTFFPSFFVIQNSSSVHDPYSNNAEVGYMLFNS